jgi:hypothetical protein
MPDTIYVVVVRVSDPVKGSPIAAAIHQGYGPEYVKAYLQTKMPAGSPLEIRSVHEAS